MYAVVACSRCRRSLVVEEGRKQASCARCSRPLDLANLRAFHRTEDLDEARDAAGRVNARLSGREGEYLQALVPPAPRATRHDDRFHAAAAAARRHASANARADALVRALGEFTREDLERAFDAAGLPADRLGPQLERMLATQVVFEPRPLRFRAL